MYGGGGTPFLDKLSEPLRDSFLTSTAGISEAAMMRNKSWDVEYEVVTKEDETGGFFYPFCKASEKQESEEQTKKKETGGPLFL